MTCTSFASALRPFTVHLAVASLFTALPLVAQAPELTQALMPMPVALHATAGQLVLNESFSAATTAFSDPRLEGAIGRALEQLRQRTGMPFNTAISSHGEAKLRVEVGGPGQAVQSVEEIESYALTITPQDARIKAATVVGAMHGLETLVQLVQITGNVYSLPAVEIHDEPRFPWRGLMVDCGRHFESVAELKRTLDGMAAVKLNVFHWHLTEDQGFRIESKLYPKLTALGSDGLFYTQDDAREIVLYARERGIRVVPEFEMPGHSTAWLVAYPELGSGQPPSSIRREFGVSEVALDPTREETYTFVERFLGEMAMLFPDAYVHIGGDETVSPEWKSDPRFQHFMRDHQIKDPDALQAYFNQRVLRILTRLHKHMVGWDEILNPTLPRDVVVQSWRGESSLVKGAQQGYQGILSAGYYLDAMQPAGVHYLVDPLPATAALSTQQRALILGGEICMFAEHVNERTLDSRLWPRSAAIAERFWSPATVNDVPDMYRRLEKTSVELEQLGLHHLTAEDAGLRELAGTEQIDDLRTFASVLEPVSFHERYELQHTSQLTVLDRFVDAVRPDPPARFEMERLTRAFLQNPQANQAEGLALIQRFERLRQSAPGAQHQIAQSPLLADVAPRAQQLPQLAAMGIDAVRYASGTQRPPAGWKQQSLASLEAARKPEGIVRFVFLDDLVLLVNATP